MSDLRPRLLQIINEFLWQGEEPCYFTEGDAGPMLDRVEDLLAKEGYVKFNNADNWRLNSDVAWEVVGTSSGPGSSNCVHIRAVRWHNYKPTEKPQEPPLPNVGT